MKQDFSWNCEILCFIILIKILFSKYYFKRSMYMERVITNQGSQFRTVPIGTVDIFRTGTWNGTKTSSFRIGLNTDSTGSVLAIPVEILDFGRKVDTGPKQKHQISL